MRQSKNARSFEELLAEHVGGKQSDLWNQWVEKGGTRDKDRFVLWLEESGYIPEGTSRPILLAQRLDVAGRAAKSASKTLAEIWDSDNEFPAPEIVSTGETVLSAIAEGAMGDIFLVRDDVLRRKVARKSLAQKMTGNTNAIRRFIAEAQISAQLDHPNIISVHQLSEDEEGRPSYTMKLINGEGPMWLKARSTNHCLVQTSSQDAAYGRCQVRPSADLSAVRAVSRRGVA